MASSSSDAQIALRYAEALLRVADQSNAAHTVEQDMRDLLAMMSSSHELARTLSSPLLGRNSLQKLMTTIADKASFNQVTKNFLGVLAQNGRLKNGKDIAQQVLKLCAARRGEMDAVVRSAVALTPEQQRALQDALKKSLGFNVHLHITVDPSLLGGMMVTVGSQLIDDTVKSKLDRLKQTLQSTSNQNTLTKEVA